MSNLEIVDLTPSRLDILIEDARKVMSDAGVFSDNAVNQLGISGGKDSAAIYLLAYELKVPNLKPVFCDTDNEHELTVEFATNFYKSLPGSTPVEVLKREVSIEEFKAKRERIKKLWRREHKVRGGALKGTIFTKMGFGALGKALRVIKPTGNAFLDLCLMQSMFPTRVVKFCTDKLKIEPVRNTIWIPEIKNGRDVFAWSGVRADESASRAKYEVLADDTNVIGLKRFSPILNWTAKDVFDMHKRHGIEPNPLYKMGMSRVGCMPCIHCNKSELKEISRRFPEHIDRIERWEDIINTQSRWGIKTGRKVSFVYKSKDIEGIRQAVEWACTSGRGTSGQMDLVDEMSGSDTCSSVYGLCE